MRRFLAWSTHGGQMIESPAHVGEIQPFRGH